MPDILGTGLLAVLRLNCKSSA